MRATMTRRIDSLGRVVLPKELRNQECLPEGTPLDILLDEEGNILLRKSARYCVLCGSSKQIRQECGKALCASCMERIAKTREGAYENGQY